MSGWLGDLSDKQQTALDNFKKRLQDVLQPHHDDQYLLRWLRARNFDLQKSEQMLRNSLQWRKQTGADTILETFKPPEVLLKYYPGGLFGFDKEGSPIYIENAGYADIKGILHSVKRSDLVKFKICCCETIQKLIKAQNEKLGHDCRGLVIVCDMQNYGLKHMCKPAIEIYNEVLTIFEAHYPESLKKAYVINAPRIFPVFYNILKPFIHEETKKKVHVLGGNWRERLLQDVDSDQLPVHWGGTATDEDGDEFCKSKICIGGDVPKEFYIQENLQDMSSFTSITVNRGSQALVPVEVTEPNSVIRWQFQTDNKDIKFSLYRGSAKGESLKEMEQLLPIQKVNSHMVLEDGSYTCDTPACYVLVFDNSYSYLTSKKVKYLLEVLPPDELSGLETSQSFCLPNSDN